MAIITKSMKGDKVSLLTFGHVCTALNLMVSCSITYRKPSALDKQDGIGYVLSGGL